MSMRDPAIDKMLRQTWQYLPPELKKTSHNISTIRFGTVCFTILIIAGFLQMIATSTPADFLGRIISFNTIVALLGVAGAIYILAMRSMQIAPRFIDTYVQMLPDYEEEIRNSYAERGLADVIAPWVRGKGRLSALLRHLAKRFHFKV